MKGFDGLTGICGCVLNWLTTLNLDQENDQSFDIYYQFPNGHLFEALYKVRQLTDLTNPISAPACNGFAFRKVAVGL